MYGLFRILKNYPVNHVTVFDRWGREVYGSEGYKNDWGATNYNGHLLMDGTYYYVIEFPEIGESDERCHNCSSKQIISTTMNLKSALTVLVLVGLSLSGSAQQTPLVNHMYVNNYLMNPAYAGDKGANLYLLNRLQWADVEGAPETFVGTIDGDGWKHQPRLRIDVDE